MEQKYLNQKFGGSKQASKIYNAISDAGKQVGIFFQFNRIKRTPNSFASHRLLEFGHKKKKQNQIIESIFYSYFVEGKDISKLEELITIAKQNDLNEQETNNYLTSNQDKKEILQEETQARKMGIRGVPCFIINKKYVIPGVPEEDRFIDLFYKLY